MAKIEWKSKTEIDAEKVAQEQAKIEKEKFKGKSLAHFKQNERDELLERMAKDLGYL